MSYKVYLYKNLITLSISFILLCRVRIVLRLFIWNDSTFSLHCFNPCLIWFRDLKRIFRQKYEWYQIAKYVFSYYILWWHLRVIRHLHDAIGTGEIYCWNLTQKVCVEHYTKILVQFHVAFSLATECQTTESRVRYVYNNFNWVSKISNTDCVLMRVRTPSAETAR